MSLFSQQNVLVKTKIWKPNNFCEFPEDINICYKISCSDCSWSYTDCEKINKKKLTGVHINFISELDTSFNLTSKFENIQLKRNKSDEILHPIAILMAESNYNSKSDEKTYYMTYMNNKFKVDEYNLIFELDIAYDLILLFKDADYGDTIIIDDFINKTIKEE